MASKYRITVNFRDEALYDIVRGKASELKKNNSRYIEEILWQELADDMDKRQRKIFAEMEGEFEDKLNNGMPTAILEKVLNSTRKFNGQAILNLALQDNFRNFGFIAHNLRDLNRVIVGKIEINVTEPEKKEVNYLREKIKDNIDIIIRAVAKKNIDIIMRAFVNENIESGENEDILSTPLTSPLYEEYDILLALINSINITFLEVKKDTLSIRVSINLCLIPFSSKLNKNIHHIQHLDFSNISYRSFKEVATMSMGPVYYRLIHIETEMTSNRGGYFIGYRNTPMNLSRVKEKLANIKAMDINANSYDKKTEGVFNLDALTQEAKKSRLAHKSINFKIINTENGTLKLHFNKELLKINTSSFTTQDYKYKKNREIY